FDADARRLTDKELLDLPDAPEPRDFRRGGGPGGRFGPQSPFFQMLMAARRRSQFVIAEGAALMIEQSRQGGDGTLVLDSANVPGQAMPMMDMDFSNRRRVSAWDKDAPKTVPQVVCSTEHFNRLARMIEAGEKLKVSVDLDVEFHDADLMAYNTVAEIPG